LNDGGLIICPRQWRETKMFDSEILIFTANAIRKRLGSISDLPPEMANTIANVYYRLCLETQQATPGRLPQSVVGSGDLIGGLTSHVKHTAHLLASASALPEMVTGFRELDPVQQPNARRAALDLFLDMFKYNISNAHRKIGLRRMIERKFKQVDEIPNLAAKLDSVGGAVNHNSSRSIDDRI